MKPLIIGAGRMAMAAAYELIRHKDIELLGLVDSSIRNIENIAKKFRKTSIVPIHKSINDLTPNDVHHYDVMIVTAPYKYNLKLTRLAIESKIHMCDLGGNNDIVQKQLLLDSEAKKARVRIIPDCGLAPGLACMLAAHGIHLLNGKAEIVTIKVGGIPVDVIPPFYYQSNWSIAGLINEYKEPCETVFGGKLKKVKALDNLQPYELPINNRIFEQFIPNKLQRTNLESFNTSGGLSTLCSSFPDLYSLSYQTIRHAGHCQIMRALDYLGLLTEETLIEALVNESYHDSVIVDVNCYDRDEKNHASFFVYNQSDRYNPSELSSMANTTGFSIACVAKILTKDNFWFGVQPGERVLPLEDYFRMVGNRTGIKISMSCKTYNAEHYFQY